MIRSAMAVALMALFCGTVLADKKFSLTGENTKITFVGTKKEGKHEGGFAKLTGSVTADGGVETAKIVVDIDTDSLYSDDKKLTGHLKSADFFDVKNNPKAKFVSSKIAKSGDGYSVTGSLTLNGKTKEITFPATITLKDNLSLKSTFKINRGDWGMSYGKGKIDDEVSLTVSVDAK